MATTTGAPSWGTCRVYGTWRNYDGTNKDGTVSVRIPHEVRNATDDVIIPAGMFIKEMALNTAASSVSFDQGLPANDDPDNAPVEWGKVEITVKFKDGADTEKYVIDTPVDGEVNLRTIIDPGKFTTQKAMLVRGVPGGVAGLDGNGDVIDADGNVITGGGSGGAVASVNGKTGAVNLTAADVGARSDTWTPDLSAYAKTTDLNDYVPTSSNRLLPGGGSSGQILAKNSGGDYDVAWVDDEGGAVDSVNGYTGAVVLAASDVGAVPTSRKVNNKALSSDVTLTASDVGALPDSTSIPNSADDVGAVPTTRTVNGKALSSDVTLTASDVGALPDSTSIPSTAADVDAVPDTRTVNGKALSSDIALTAADVGALDDSTTVLSITFSTTAPASPSVGDLWGDQS